MYSENQVLEMLKNMQKEHPDPNWRFADFEVNSNNTIEVTYEYEVYAMNCYMETLHECYTFQLAELADLELLKEIVRSTRENRIKARKEFQNKIDEKRRAKEKERQDMETYYRVKAALGV